METFVIAGLFFLLAVTLPIYIIAMILQMLSTSRAFIFFTSFVLYILWCVAITWFAFFTVAGGKIGIYFLVPVAPVAMVIGIGTLYYMLKKLLSPKPIVAS